MLLAALPLQMKSPNLPLDWRAVPFHLFLVQCWWPFSKPVFYNYLNVPSWSISCEWFFYLAAPPAMFLMAGRRRRWFLLLAVLAYAAGMAWFLMQGQSDFTRLYLLSWFAPSRLPEFFAGVLLAQVYLARPAPVSAGPSCLFQAAGIALIVAGALYRSEAPWPLWGGLLYVPGAALFVLGLAWGRGPLAAYLGGPRVIRLGMASFCLYMMQAPLLRAAKGVCLRLGWEVASPIAFACTVVVMFFAVQVLALLLHRYYEMPLQKFLRVMDFRLSVPDAPTSAPKLAGRAN
jgi:peptidoglycan/LPS O-acetylase OafA/YrhL